MTTADEHRFGEVTRTPDGTYTVRFQRRLAHPVARVWTALTNPAEARHWFTEMTLEAGPGGAIHLDFGDEGEAHGTVLTWQPPHILEHSWREAGVTSHVQWDLRPDDGHTILTLTHTRLATDSPHEYGAGWHEFLDRLPAHLDGVADPAAEDRFEVLLEQYERRLRADDHTART